MQLFEPQRGVTILQGLNSWISSSNFLFVVVSFFADYPILLLPLFLVIIYIIGIKKKNIIYKEYALYILFSCVIAVVINFILQKFLIKSRPETVLQGTHNLLMKHLPTMSFPSDHAAVSMAFGFTVYYLSKLFGTIKRRQLFRGLGIAFIISSVVMSVSRVAVGVHRPTDIIAGWIIGIIAAYKSTYIPKKLLRHIIFAEEWLCKKIGIDSKT